MLRLENRSGSTAPKWVYIAGGVFFGLAVLLALFSISLMVFRNATSTTCEQIDRWVAGFPDLISGILQGVGFGCGEGEEEGDSGSEDQQNSFQDNGLYLRSYIGSAAPTDLYPS